MNSEIENGIALEKNGQFDLALKLYNSILETDLSNSEKLFTKRSIAACLFYLKMYSEAEKIFLELINSNEIEKEEISEIQNCLNISFLYGSNPKKASLYFKDVIDSSFSKPEKIIWAHWYLGQYYFRCKVYKKSNREYLLCYSLSSKSEMIERTLFLAHLVISYLLINNLIEAENLMRRFDQGFSEDNSNGLIEITKGIIGKIKKTNESKWKEYFNNGIKTAINCNFHENVDLGEFLLNKFG